jgi:hypothetical protein
MPFVLRRILERWRNTHTHTHTHAHELRCVCAELLPPAEAMKARVRLGKNPPGGLTAGDGVRKPFYALSHLSAWAKM